MAGYCSRSHRDLFTGVDRPRIDSPRINEGITTAPMMVASTMAPHDW